MAVYTEVDRDTLERFLAKNFDLGRVEVFAGIPEGIENTNYCLKTETGRFILTLFEKRTPDKDLPFFMRLMAHLAGKGIPCPRPVAGAGDKVLFKCRGKKAVIITFLPGTAAMEPNPKQCFKVGKLSAEMHAAAANFMPKRKNPLGLSGLKAIYARIEKDMKSRLPALGPLAATEFGFQTSLDYSGLPEAVVHADLFPDNVFFEQGRVTGVIDFYFAATDAVAYDLAVTANSWCFSGDGCFSEENFSALIKGYETVRPLGESERTAFPALLRRAALRFLLTRSEDWLSPPKGVMGIVKDPWEYGKILSFHQKRRHIEDYL